MDTLFLAIRMVVYVAAVPVAAWLGGTFDPETGILTLDVDLVIDAAVGVIAAAGAFLSGRIAKAKGWAT